MNQIQQAFFRLIIFLIWLFNHIRSLIKPKPQILVNLKLNEQVELKRRVIKEFPLGSSVIRLKQNLRQQNFKLATNQNCATYHQLSFLGDIYYIICWQSNKKNKISNLEVEIISRFV